MPLTRPAPSHRVLEIFLYCVLFLCFLQLITDFVEAIYAFGLMGTSITAEIASILLLFSPLVLLILPRGLSRWQVVVLGETAILCRAVEIMLDTRGQMLVAGVGVACFLIFFPSLLISLRRDKSQDNAFNLTIGLALSILLLIFLRVAGSGQDVTLDGSLRWLSWPLVIAAGILLPGAMRKEDLGLAGVRLVMSSRMGRVMGLSLGIAAVWTLLYFAFSSPNVLVRWTEANYPLVVGGITLALICFILLMATSGRFMMILKPKTVIVWNFIFLLSLVLTILPFQLRFPTDPTGYPFYEPTVPTLVFLPLVLTILLFPVILVDFLLFIRELLSIQPTWRGLGAGFTLGSLYLLVMILAHVFTTVYDYIPVIGSAFRDRFWLVYLVAGLGIALPVLLVRKSTYNLSSPQSLSWKAAAIGVALTVLVITFVFIFGSNRGLKVTQADQDQRLKILTYNIQQGYSEDGLKNFHRQLELIRSIDADIIGLQESDTNRIALGNTDGVRYLADRLKMYSYYGPKTVTGTFGIALLSKYPLLNPRTFFMFSQGEQTATIQAQISAGGKSYNIFVTHLGNDGPIVQQEAILKVVKGLTDVILMGDFNFRPDTEQYHLTTQLLVDAWASIWPQGFEDSGLIPKDRIDHIFLSPGLSVLEARYDNDPASDHPALTVEIGR